LSVKGSIRATGDVLVGSKSVNVLEELLSLRKGLRLVEADSFGGTPHASCNEAYTKLKKAADGKAPISGQYLLHGHTSVYKVWCEMDDDGGWLRLGKGGMDYDYHNENVVRCAFFRQKFTPEDDIGSHACLPEASRRADNAIPLACPLFFTL
jgi:hypothetical protein